MITKKAEKNSINIVSLNDLLPLELAALKQYYDMKWTGGCKGDEENHAMKMSNKIAIRLEYLGFH